MNRLTQAESRRASKRTEKAVPMSSFALATENARFAGTGGVSRRARAFRFLPAFRDSGTGQVYLSRFADGHLAPIHMLDGLPDQVVVARHGRRVTAVKASIVSGFVRDRRFYTRAEAAAAARRERVHDQGALAANH
jgi:hypothetical protein